MLTANERFWLKELAESKMPRMWTHRRKAIGNKFIKLGFATYNFGYPTGFVITAAGRAALSDEVTR